MGEAQPYIQLVPPLSVHRPILGIVVPCFNEEEVIQYTIEQLQTILKDLIEKKIISKESYLLFVDDGSKDRTWQKIESLHRLHPHIQGLKLARNVGHQNALLAGLIQSKRTADCVISIDADLQDDISKIEDFVRRYLDGYDVVYGIRSKRDTDTLFKKHTALWFYGLMEKLGVKVINNHADYRLMSKRALDELEKFNESNLFLRGIVPLLGYKSTEVFYDRKERAAGESKYPLKKMINFAVTGITSFSVVPIRLATVLGMIMLLFAFLIGGYALWGWIRHETVQGWTSMMISMWFIGGILAICIGITGEYIGKIYQEVKRRPKYTIEEELSR